MIIEHSAEMGELFKALSKLQVEIGHPKKDKDGFKGNYKYAELSQYIDVSKDTLSKYGLSVIQLPGEIEIVEITQENIIKDKAGYVVSRSFETIKIPKQSVYTTIGHDSGQYMMVNGQILVEKLSGMSYGQSTGSAISFMRKYSRGGGLSMSQEDDDNQGVRSTTKKNQEYIPQSVPKITKEEAAKLRGLISHDPTPYLIRMRNAFNVGSIEELEPAQYIKMMDRLREEGLADQKIEKVA
jgi:hypothetical protein